MAIDIIASVVPNISKSTDSRVYFYVYLTPRISCSGREPLENFKHIYNWTDYFSFFDEKNVTFKWYNESIVPKDDLVKVSLEGTGYRGHIIYTRDWHHVPDKPNVLVADQPKWAKTIWRGLMSASTPVNGWELDKNAYKLLQKLDLKVLNDQMNRTIGQYKQKLLTFSLRDLQIPGFYDSAQDEEDQRAALLDILNHLFELSADRKLASPYINNPNKAINYPQFLQQLHDDLAKFNAQRDQELSDLSLKLSLQQVEENNNNETNEFHKKMAAFGNFPFLLKQTGWIWEYSVDKKDFLAKAKGDKNVFIQVQFQGPKPDNNQGDLGPCRDCDSTVRKTPGGDGGESDNLLDDFRDNIRFSYPVTYLSIREEQPKYLVDYGFKITQDFAYLPIKDGIIGTVKGSLIRAEYLEKNQVFDRITQILQQKYNFSYRKDQAADSAANQQQLQTVAAALPPQKQQEIDVANQERIHAANNNSGGSPTTDYNSVGVSVEIEDLKGKFQNAVAASPGLNFSALAIPADAAARLEAATVIYGHNLHKGYRVDFFPPGHESYSEGKSLTKRRTFYTIDFGKQPPPDKDKDSFYAYPPCIVDDDEGWVVESAQGSNSGSLYVDGELFRYNDWSLCADRVFQSTDSTPNSNEQVISQNSNITIFSVPQQHSLPRLRYGHPYNIVLRYVDICGGGRTIDDSGVYPDMFPPPCRGSQVTHLRRYPRTQGIGAPLAFLGKSLHKRYDRSAHYRPDTIGEDLLTMVIRSYSTGTGFNCRQDTVRYIAPPKLDFDTIKKHGVFDALMAEVGKLPRDGAPDPRAEGPSEKIRTLITFDEPPPKLNEQEDPTEEVMMGSKDIDYLFDPLCRGYMLWMNGVREKDWPLKSRVGDSLDCTGYQQTYLDEVKYMKLVLTPGSDPTAYDYSVDPVETYSRVIKLQEGMEKELDIVADLYASIKVRDFIDPLSIGNLLYDKQTNKSRLRLRLVHAVQRPCLLYAWLDKKNFHEKYTGDITTFGRASGETLVNIKFHFNLFPCLTAETYLLHVTYTDTISYRQKYLPDGKPNYEGFITSPVRKVIKTGFLPEKAGVEQDVVFNDLRHTFNDSKYRQVKYELEAVSRFKKYFPVELGNFSIAGDDPRATVPILSSHQPPALEVDRIVPLIRWEGKDLHSGLERKCDTIRIYLTGDWFLTGGGPQDESVAVFFVNMDGINSKYVPRELENVISQMGLDPTTDRSTACAHLPTIDDLFFDPGSATILPKVTLIDFESERLIRIKNLDFENSGNNPYCDDVVTAAIFKVQFMPPQDGEDQGGYYIDIKLRRQEDIQKLYFPFIRFAMARYQENTIDTVDADGDGIDSRFSKVIVTDFVQLLPYRKIGLNAVGQLVYRAGAIRATPVDPKFKPPWTVAPNALVYLHGDNSVMGVEGLTNVCLPDKSRSIDILSADTDYVVAEASELTGSWILEEYEHYAASPDIVLDDKMAAREKFTHRMIFNYFHQP